jgi:predicted nucleic acid binding AN1-type Zn finger protein
MIREKKINKSKLGRCSYCKKVLTFLPHTCQYCGKKFCRKHRLPENHDCTGDPKRPTLR